jgi:predicted RNA-binding Zn ribbon-like protein
MKESADSKFLFIGNNLCLDFVNTEVIDNGERVDLMKDFSSFVSWSRQAGLLSADQASSILKKGSGVSGSRAYKEAAEFRRALREIVQLLAEKRRPDIQSIEPINRVLKYTAGWNEIVPAGKGFEKRFHMDFENPAHLLVPVAESAAALLTNRERILIRKCKNPNCILYFFDSSKNHSRRWCSMTECGNRAKASSYYRRSRKNQ